jgi:hypothetical protein
MLLHHELLATGLPELASLHAYYNATVSPLDCREPSYRHVVFAASSRPRDELAIAVAALRSDGDTPIGRAALQAIAGAVLAQRLGSVMHSGEISALQAKLEEERAAREALGRQLADREAHLLDRHADLLDRDAQLLVARDENAHLRREVEHLRRRLSERIVSKVRSKSTRRKS